MANLKIPRDSLFDSNNKNTFNYLANNKEKTGTFKMSEIVSALTSRNEADMDKYACSEILLCMEAYYKVRSPSKYLIFVRGTECYKGRNEGARG